MCFSVEEPIVQVVSGVPRGDKSVRNVPSTSYNFGTGYLGIGNVCTIVQYCMLTEALLHFIGFKCRMNNTH
jgi:hypothetical protein